jgi:trimeric autotransporter adhesin
MTSRLSRRGAVALTSALALLVACGSDKKAVSPPPPAPPAPQVVSVAVSVGQPSAAKGISVAVAAKAIYDDGSAADVTSKAAWSSSDAAVAKIVADASGSSCRAASLAVGTVQLTAAFGGKTGSASFDVTKERAVSLAIAPAAVSLAKGTKQALAASGIFTDDSHQEITSDAAWTSSDASVAVFAAGQLEARGVGSATLTAFFDGQNASLAVTVTDATLTGIAIDQAPFTMIAALDRQLSVTGFFTDDSAHGVEVAWASDNAGVAKVSETGVVTAMAKGSATITATSGSFTKSIVVTVDDPKLIAVEVAAQNAFASLPKGLTAQLVAVAKFDNGKTADVSNDKTTVWTSSNPAIASVSATGLVSASKASTGSLKILAQFGGFGGVLDLTVSAAVPTKVDVAPATFTIPAGLGGKQFSATATFSDGSVQPATSLVTWSSSSTICAISGGALATSAPGSCVLTASLSGVKGTADVTVSNAALVAVTITPLPSQLKPVPLGLTQAFKATGSYTDKSSHEITNQVVWTSSDDTVASISNASVDKGLASGLALGTTTIKAEDPDTHLATTVPLAVVDAVVMKLEITCNKSSLPRAVAPDNLAACTAMGTFSVPNLVRDLTADPSILWKISDAKMATISGAGVVTTSPTSKLGKVKITATFPGRTAPVVSNEVEIVITDAQLVKIDVAEVPVHERLKHTNIDAPPFYPVSFTAKGHYTDATTADLTNTATWKVAAGSTCTISTKGVATGSAPGTCTVSASQAGVTSNSASFGVLDLVLNGIEVDPLKKTIANGFPVNYSAWGLYVLQGTFFPYEFEFTNVVSWTTVDVSAVKAPVAIISSVPGNMGVLNTKNVGTAQVVATFRGIAGAARLDVTPAILLSLEIDPAEQTIIKGLADQQFTVEGKFSDDSKSDVTSSVTCSSSDIAIASPVPYQSCKFHGVAAGTVTITADAGLAGVTPVKATLNVTKALLAEAKMLVCDARIIDTPVFMAAIRPGCFDVESFQIAVDQNTVFAALGRLTDGTWVDITQNVVWDSSAIPIAQVSNDQLDLGTVTGLSEGQATITAILKSGVDTFPAGQVLNDSVKLAVVR